MINYLFIICFIGTGSGSLSHSLIRAIQPSGHLYTFDFHEERVSVAKEEFQRHGLEGYVTIQHRDVCINGFGDNLNGKADVVFLDLPHPWLVISHALKALKESGIVNKYFYNSHYSCSLNIYHSTSINLFLITYYRWQSVLILSLY